METNMGKTQSQFKKRKFDKAPEEEAMNVDNTAALVLSKKPESSQAADEVPELVPRVIERLSTPCNPIYHTLLKTNYHCGYERDVGHRFIDPRFYEINVKNFRTALVSVMKAYLAQKYFEVGKIPASRVNPEVESVADLCADACMSALYAKLRNMHKQYGNYSTRYGTPPTYAKDIQLPLPFADAIQQLGTFESKGMDPNYLFVPCYPEGTKNEGRSKEEWHSYRYEECLPTLKECGIPLKSVDTRLKYGSAWWTYQLQTHNDTFDLQAIIPRMNYSDHSTTLFTMFAMYETDGQTPLRIIKYNDNDPNYGFRLREIHAGSSARAFAALCHAPEHEWNYEANTY